MSVALTGATGFVGQAVIDLAGERELAIRALTRRTQRAHDHITWVNGSLSNKSSLTHLCEGAGLVIHVAGLTNAPDPTAFHAANVEGTQAMIEAAKAARITRFIFVSSLAAREPELSAYGASKAEAEALVKASGLDWTIVRPPGVYGPRDIDYFEMFRSAKWGFIPLPPHGKSSIIHVHDLARLLLDLVNAPPALVHHHVFEPDDGREGGWEHDELARAIGAAVGRKVFAPHLPKPALNLAAWADQLLRGDKARLTRDRVGYMTHPNWVSRPDRKVPDTIWKPEIEGAEGLRKTADWYRNEGWL